MQLKVAYLGIKFNQDFLVHFDGGHNLELEQSLTKVWAIERPGIYLFQFQLERCSWNSGWTRASFPETESDSKPSEVGQVVFLGTSGIGWWSMVSSWPMSRISSIIEGPLIHTSAITRSG